MIETVARKRIEVLADTPLIPKVIEIVKAADISGWSVLHVDSGGGRDGRWQHDELTGASAKAIVLVIANEAKAEAFVDALAPVLTSYGLLLIVGDVQVVRGERF